MWPEQLEKMSNAKIWREAILLAIKQREDADPLAIRKLANMLLNECDKGDIGALKELGDRLDGKPSQYVDLAIVEKPVANVYPINEPTQLSAASETMDSVH